MDISKLRKKAKAQQSSPQGKQTESGPESAPEAFSEEEEFLSPASVETSDEQVHTQVPTQSQVQDEDDEFLDSPSRPHENTQSTEASSEPSLLDAALGADMGNHFDPDDYEADDEDDEYAFDYEHDEEDEYGLGLFEQLGQVADYDDREEYLFFTASDEPYALRISRIKEIIKPRDLSVVPRGPDSMRGILALRGEMIPVVDLMVVLGLRNEIAETAFPLANNDTNFETDDYKPRIIVLAHEDEKLGLYVDHIEGVVQLDENLFEDPLTVQGNRDNRYVSAIGRMADGFVIVLDVEEFFRQGDG